MKVTWTVPVVLESYHGQQVLCRSEEEAAQLILELFAAGVHRRFIIVDGVNQERNNMSWVFKALGV